MPAPFIRSHRLSVAYAILVVVVAIGFYQLGGRLNTETQQRRSGVGAVLAEVCAQNKARARIAAANWLAQRTAWVAARDARHLSALLDQAAGNKRQAAIDQAASDSYDKVVQSITVPPATYRC